MTDLAAPRAGAPAPDALTGLGRRSALGLAGAAANGVAQIGTILLANRSLDADALGQFFVAITVFSLAQGICSLGIDGGLQFWVPSLRAHAARRLLNRSYATVAATGVLAGVLVFVLARPFADLVAEEGAGDATALLRGMAMLVPFAGIYEAAFGSLRACDRILPAVVLDRFLRPAAQLGAMVAVAATGGSARAMVFAYTMPIVASILIALVIASHPASVARLAGTRDRLRAIEFWRYTTPRAVARIAQVLTQRLDVLLLASLGSVADAGVYGTVSRCMVAGVFVATAVQQMVQPRLRRLIVRNETDAVRAMYGASTTWLVLATWPAYLSMAIFSPLVLGAFGDDAVRGQDALSLLCVTMLVASACGLVDVVLLMLGRSWLSTANVLAALALNAALNLVLIPSFGMDGAAVAWSAAILTTNLAPLYQVWRTGLHPGGTPLTTAITSGLLAFGLPMLAGRALGGPELRVFVASLAVALPTYVAVVLHWRRRVLLHRFFGDLVRRGASQAHA